MKKPLVVLTTLLVAACAYVDGRDNFKSKALTQSAELPGNYQALAYCFEDNKTFARPAGLIPGPTSDKVRVYSDLGRAEYIDQVNNGWFQLIEFQKVDTDRTKVDAYAVSADNLTRMWKTIESCSKA